MSNNTPYPFSTRTDKLTRGDGLQEIIPEKVTREEDRTIYHFPAKMFHNPRYTIPEDDNELFKAFINGGSRSYSSDGQIPAIIATIEAQNIIKEVRKIAVDHKDPFNALARKAIVRGKTQIGDWEVVRGTVGLMLGKWMSSDWQKKRSTDDIDFYWENMDTKLFAHVMRKCGWTSTGTTPGNQSIWTKKIPECGNAVLECCNDTVIGRDFAGTDQAVYGIGLKNIVKKKLSRCHEVDISDVINIALSGYFNIDEEEERHPWRAVMEVLNRNSVDDCAHIILICQYSFAILEYYRNLGRTLETHAVDFLDKNLYDDESIKEIYLKQTPVVAGGSSYFRVPVFFASFHHPMTASVVTSSRSTGLLLKGQASQRALCFQVLFSRHELSCQRPLLVSIEKN